MIISYNKTVAEHYAQTGLLQTIQNCIAKLGKTIDSVTVEDLAPVDEFHVGGRLATQHLLDQLHFSRHDHVLDVGCGLGGTSRLVASKYNNRMTGIDLTQDYIDAGNALCAWVGLDKQITLHQGSALSMPFEDATFDGALMLHVGMNIEDKVQLFTEIYRVLRPGASFAIYDIMKIHDGELSYPVPWATEYSTNKLATPEQYKQSLRHAGFKSSKENHRLDFTLAFFKRLRAKNKKNGGPPPLGLHTLMEESAAIKVKNMLNGITSDLIRPVEIIAHKCE